MAQHSSLHNGIPISASLNESIRPERAINKKRLLTVSALAILIAGVVSFIAKLLVNLIDLVTNISFYGQFSIAPSSPAANHLGIFVVIIPVIGGLVVGLMALYGSRAIRGHGIPEAMEQILTNQSKIKPAITYLKPLSAAISIGTGGPFGAEGPIIATGGALGSTIGQLLKITHNERKVLLASGATAGMSAIFGTPIAAIFLAVELLLFEFSPRSILPVALACVTGAAGHYLLFGTGAAFPVKSPVELPSNIALICYSVIGIAIGGLSVLITKAVYFIEDVFEQLPVHWVWWPAIGGLAAGVVGYFAPRTLGVGYNNISDILSGSLPVKVILSLCLLKFISWSIALGSGTSGGTLAPLLTIGGAAGALMGSMLMAAFPAWGVTLPLAALVGMAAMFAGASRAMLTSIIFAIETTAQTNALLPLLAACTGSYFISFMLMKNTIMTEKIARRGVVTPQSYEADILERATAGDVVKTNGTILSEDNSIEEARNWLNSEPEIKDNYFIIASTDGKYKGIISSSNLFSHHHHPNNLVGTLIKRENISISMADSLRTAVEMMATENIDVLPVLSPNTDSIIGILTYKDILAVYKQGIDEHRTRQAAISLKRNGLKILLHGHRFIAAIKNEEK